MTIEHVGTEDRQKKKNVTGIKIDGRIDDVKNNNFIKVRWRIANTGSR